MATASPKATTPKPDEISKHKFVNRPKTNSSTFGAPSNSISLKTEVITRTVAVTTVAIQRPFSVFDASSRNSLK